MTFGEKIKEARLAMNLSQTELAQMTGISERSLYTYEQLGTLPRKSNIRKLAEALHISVSYLLDESETDSQSHIDQDMFILEAKENFGSKGAKEAQEVLGRVNSLFAGENWTRTQKMYSSRRLCQFIWTLRKQHGKSTLRRNTESIKIKSKILKHRICFLCAIRR